jgi:hypothetical protein
VGKWLIPEPSEKKESQTIATVHTKQVLYFLSISNPECLIYTLDVLGRP